MHPTTIFTAAVALCTAVLAIPLTEESIIQAKLKSVAEAHPELAESIETVIAAEYGIPSKRSKRFTAEDDMVINKLKSVAAANPELADSIEILIATEYELPG
ncbi:hypothetical protein F4808DRAFT_467140 [Astrocystis sublimbata]|nr:hypothetical protein F4808DRAFT_467140 [Astrocystis sublimbata]